MEKFLANVAKVRKALIAAASVAATLAAAQGVPADVKQAALDFLAVLAAGGITYRVPNSKS